MSNYDQFIARGDSSALEIRTYEIYCDLFNWKLVDAGESVTVGVNGVDTLFNYAALKFDDTDKDSRARIQNATLNIAFNDDIVVENVIGLIGYTAPITCVERIYIDTDLTEPLLTRTFYVKNPTLQQNTVTLPLEHKSILNQKLTTETITSQAYPALPL